MRCKCQFAFAAIVVTLLTTTAVFAQGRRTGGQPAEARPFKTFDGHQAEVLAVAFSPDGKWLASAGDSTLRLWDIETGKAGPIIKGHDGPVHAIAFAKDGSLASAGADKTVRLWSPTGEAIATLPGHTDVVATLAFSPGGQVLASAGHDRSVKLWDVVKRSLIVSKQDHADKVLALAFSSDGKTLATGGADQTVHLRDPANAEVRAKWASPVERKDIPITSLAFTGDGQRLAVVHAGLLGRIYDVASQKAGPEIYARARHTGLPGRLAFFGGDADWVASNSEYVYCGNSGDGAETTSFKADEQHVLALAYDPKGGWLATGGADRAVKLWSLPGSRPFAELEHFAVWIALDAKGQTLYAQGDHDVTVWDVGAGKPRVSYGMDDGWVISRGGWAGRFAFAWPIDLKDPSLKVRKDGKVSKQQLIPLLKLAKGGVIANARLGQYVVIDEKGDSTHGLLRRHINQRPPNLFATSTLRNAIGNVVPPPPKPGTEEDDKAYVELRLLKAIKGSSLGGYDDLLGLAFSPDGKALAILETGVIVHLWDAANGVRRGKLETELSPMAKGEQPIGFSADSKTFFIGNGGSVHMWDATTGKKKGVITTGHYAHAFATTSDGKTLGTGGQGGGIRIWDLDSGQLRQLLPAGYVSSLTFTPDGKTLIAAEADNRVLRAWDLNPAHFLAPAAGATALLTNKAKLTYAMHRKIDGQYRFNNIAVTPDGKWVISASASKTRVWNPLTGATYLEMGSEQLGSPAERIAVAPDGKLFATAPDRQVKLWNLTTKKESVKLPEIKHEVSSIRFSADGKTLWATPTREKQPVLAWDVVTGKETARFYGAWDHVAEISPDGKTVVGFKSDKAGVWDLASKAFIELADFRTRGWFDACYSPDGRKVAIWREEEGGRVFDAATGKLLATVATSGDGVQTVAFDPSGKVLAIGLKNENLRLWNIDQQKEIMVLREHSGPITAVAFGPGGRWLVSGGQDALLKVVDLTK